MIVTRSGYTGEVGFELFTYQDIAEELWRELLEAVAPFGGGPCGLAARDVLRLEMGYPLYGQDLFEASTAFEAGLGWAVAFDKGEFRGRAALAAPAGGGAAEPPAGAADARAPAHPARALPGVRRRPAGGRGDERHVLADARTGIALAYLWPGDVVELGRRSRWTSGGARGAATVVQPPFVDRSPR